MSLEENITSALDAVERKFAETILNSDYVGASAVFAEDAVLLAPVAEITHGRVNIQAFLGRNGRIRGIALTPSNRKSLGLDAVREVGAMRLTTVGASQLAQEFVAKYVLVWRLVGGSWAIETLMWNRVGAPNAEGRRPGQRGQGRPGVGGVGAPEGRFQPGGGAGQRAGGAAPSPYRYQPPGAGGAPGQRRLPGGGAGNDFED